MKWVKTIGVQATLQNQAIWEWDILVQYMD